jgi:hypothetical protein
MVRSSQAFQRSHCGTRRSRSHRPIGPWSSVSRGRWGRWCQAPHSAAAPLASKKYIGGVVGCGALCHPVVNRYKRGLTAGYGGAQRWQPGCAAEVQSTEAPCAAMGLPRLLLIPCCSGCPGWAEAPGRGGIGAPSAWGSPRPNAPHFPGRWGSGGYQGCSGSLRFPWLWGWCLVRLRPTAPLNSPPRRRGIPSPLRSVGIHTKGEGDVCLWGGGQPWEPGIRGPWIDGCYGSTREIIRAITKRACGGDGFRR